MNLESCLPAELRGPETTITRVAAGLSGAGVYRVEAGGQAFALKISEPDEAPADWRRKLHIRQLAADAGLAPRIVHTDEAQRAVLSDFVVDRSFPAFYANPGTREAALTQLGRTLRRVHEIPLPADAVAKDPQDFLAEIWSRLETHIALPAFVAEAVAGMLGEEAPACGRALVLSHNDVNPTNLVYDGEHLLLLDWETAGPNDPFYDLAAISVFLRMDEETCLKLLAACDAEPASALPARFAFDRRLVAILCGTAFLHLARHSGHAGATSETLETAPTLAEVYQGLRAGSLNIASGEGQWAFGLALVKEGVSLSATPS
ncbi:MAG TPA: phosphotransferase [Candidatus Obscuribacterales bacterium]